MDWLRLERRIRSVLATAADYPANNVRNDGDLALLLVEISDILGDETGRGYVFSTETAKTFLNHFGVKDETKA